MPNLDKKFIQNTFRLSEEETVDSMHMALDILDDKDSQAIFSEIVKVYCNKKNGSKGSDASSALLDMLESEQTCQDKWSALVAYCEKEENKHRTLNFVITETIPAKLPQIVFDKGKVMEDGNFKKAYEYYEQATALAKKFDKKSVSNFYRHMQKLTQVVFDKGKVMEDSNSKEAHKYYQQAIALAEKLDKNSASDFYHHMHKTAQKALSEGKYDPSYHLAFNAESSVHKHRAILLGKSVKKTADYIVKPAVVVGAIIDLTTGILAVPLGAATGVISTLVGTGHGLFRMATRELLNSEQLDRLFNNLNVMSTKDDTQKQQIITQVVQEYTKTRSKNCSSDSSYELFKVLSAPDKSVSHKWNCLTEYMTERFGNNSSIKSNGKKLFRIIDNKVTDYLKAELQPESVASYMHQ